MDHRKVRDIIWVLFSRWFPFVFVDSKNSCMMMMKFIPQANWFRANEYCRSKDMQLVSINSLEEQNNITQLIRNDGMFFMCSDLINRKIRIEFFWKLSLNNEYRDVWLILVHFITQFSFIHSTGYDTESFWTSGSRLGNGRDYVWMSTGRKVIHERGFWPPGQPDRLQNENCIEVRGLFGLKLNDWDCNARAYFVCEKYSTSSNNLNFNKRNSNRNCIWSHKTLYFCDLFFLPLLFCRISQILASLNIKLISPRNNNLLFHPQLWVFLYLEHKQNHSW